MSHADLEAIARDLAAQSVRVEREILAGIELRERMTSLLSKLDLLAAGWDATRTHREAAEELRALVQKETAA